MLAIRIMHSQPINDQKFFRVVMRHEIDNRMYTLLETMSGRFVWEVLEMEII